MTVQNFVTNLINTPAKDPEDARRRRLLNILLIGIALLPLPLIPLTLFYGEDFGFTQSDRVFIPSLVSAVFIFCGIFYAINRYISGRLAAVLFLVFLSFAILFGDTPLELSTGRSLILFAIPVMFASILLTPTSSFVFAILGSGQIIFLATSVGVGPNTSAIVVLIILALASWLSSRSLEQALHELREINKNLDSLVEQKTQDLAKSLSRELVLAGRNRIILESIADGVMVFDLYGKVIQINPALSDLLGTPYNELAETTIDDLTRSKSLNPKSQGVLMGLLTSPEKNSSSHRVEWDNKTLSINAAQVFDDQNDAMGTVAVFRDFTSEAQVEQMKSTFVAMISHELRTPLNGILGYAEMFKEAVYGPVNEKQANMSERIMKNAQRLIGLLNDLLDQAQIDAGKLAVKSETFRPRELLENLHGNMDKIASDKGLNLTTVLDPALPEKIKGDNARLQQIMINLVNNAVKFTDQGSIKTSITKLNPKQWSIEVTDSGVGIPENELNNIFETFRQVDGTTTRLHGGFGLGLSIVRQLVELMHGEIKVESKVGGGSTFTVTLPLETN